MKKKLLAMLLTICMAFSIYPSVVLAIGEPNIITPINSSKNTYEITDEQLNQVKSHGSVSPTKTYDTFYYTDGVSYTYKGKAVTFVDKDNIQVDGEVDSRSFKNKKITIDVNLDKANRSAKITLRGVDIPVDVAMNNKSWCYWNSRNVDYHIVYKTTIDGVEAVTSEKKNLSTIELTNLPKDGEFIIYGGKVFESSQSSLYDGLDFGDGKGTVKSRTFSTLPDITITMSNPKKTHEITQDQLNQRKSLPNVTPQKTYDTFYYVDEVNYTYGGKSVTFIDENTIKVDGETENRKLKNKKVCYEVKFDYEKDEVVINFSEPLEVPIGSASDGRGNWNSSSGNVNITYNTNNSNIDNVKSENKNLKTIILDGIPPIGEYTVSGGRIFESSGELYLPQFFPEPNLFGKFATEGYFSTLPDITFTVSESNQLGNVQISVEKRTIGKGDTIPLTSVKLEKGDTAKDILDKVSKLKNIEVLYTQVEGKDILSSITGDGAKDSAGWRYQVNDKFTNEGISDYKTLIDGDVIRIRYAVSAQADELKSPLVKYLEKLVIEAESTLAGGNFTLSTKTGLQDVINTAKAMIDNQDYNSTDVAKELEVSTQIKNLNVAVANLEQNADGEVSDGAQVPADFENDLWLQYDYNQMKIGDDAEIFPRRVPEASGDTINNDIIRPNFNYEIIKGDSIKLSTNKSNSSTKVTAIKDGVSIIKVTYDACEYKGLKFGASSPINTAYVIYDVNNDRSNVEIKTDIKQTSYDTIYFDKGDYTNFQFGVTANGASKIEVTCNGNVITAIGEKYMAQLENKSNIIGVTTTDNSGKTNTYYQVVDARKVEIKIVNITNPKKPVLIGDKVQVSFKGITHPVYKLAAIYNPTWRSINQGWENTYGTFVEYTSDKIGKVEGVCGQWDLATKNSITLTFTESGDYVFSNGMISSDWWGEPLGADKGVKNLPQNISADTQTGRFSIMPDFSIKVLNEISDNIPVTGITLNKTQLIMTEGETFSLKANITPENATNKDVAWSSDGKYFASVDQNGNLTAHKASTANVPEITITAKTNDGNLVAVCKVKVKAIIPAVSDNENDKRVAQNVINQIDMLETITLESEKDIIKAKLAYNELSLAQRKLVTNLVWLYKAENQFLRLKLEQKETVKSPSEGKINTTEVDTKKTDVIGTVKPQASKISEKQKPAKNINSQLSLLSTDKSDISPLQQARIVDLFKQYENLTQEQKMFVTGFEHFKESMKAVASLNQQDEKTGIKVTNTDWFVKLNITPIGTNPTSVKKMNELQKKLSDKQMLGIWDVSLANILTDSEYHPDQAVKITLPIADMPQSENICVVHYKDDGSIEYLKPEIIDNQAVFETREFSYYAVVSYTDEASPFNLNEQVAVDEQQLIKDMPQNNRPINILALIILIGGVAMLVVSLVLRKSKKIKTTAGEYSIEN